MSTLTPFTYGPHQVRTLTINGEPAFIAKDLCAVLDLSNPRTSLALLDEDERGVHTVDTPGGTQKMAYVTESGMYSFILRSRKPEAKKFKRWVTHDVLPQIRKTGAYGTPRQITGDELLARAVIEANQRLKALEATNAELQPKADAWDQIVSSAGSWSYEEAAKVLFEQGVVVIGQQRLVRQLVEWNYLYRDNKNRPHAYQKHIESGLFVTKARIYTDQVTGERRESSAPQVRITGKGLDMLFHRFRTGQLQLTTAA